MRLLTPLTGAAAIGALVAATPLAFATATCPSFMATTYNAGANAQSIALGDLNGDGMIDIAVANTNGAVHLLMSHGWGMFMPSMQFGAGHAPQSIALGDIDGDSDLDIVLADQGVYDYARQRWQDQGVLICINDGAGNFDPPLLLPFANGHSRPASVALADVNLDGSLDIVVANMDSPTYPVGEIAIVVNLGDGTFKMPEFHLAGIDTNCVATGDFNGDGLMDVAATNHGSASLTVLHGGGGGGLQPAVTIPIGAYPKWVATWDLDHDGIDDIAVLNHYELRVLIDGGASSTYALGLGFSSIAIGDINRDRGDDLIVPESQSRDLRLLFNDGNGNFPTQQSEPTRGSPTRVALGDLDNDGDLDMVFTDATTGTVTVMLNQCVPTGDFDGNGSVDGADLAILLGMWGRCGECAMDLDGDGTVGASDLAILLGAWTL
ncbi:MAG: FG-GAP-like repeat-containing protein [Phycisphaerales bacterium]